MRNILFLNQEKDKSISNKMTISIYGKLKISTHESSYLFELKFF